MDHHITRWGRAPRPIPSHPIPSHTIRALTRTRPKHPMSYSILFCASGGTRQIILRGAGLRRQTHKVGDCMWFVIVSLLSVIDRASRLTNECTYITSVEAGQMCECCHRHQYLLITHDASTSASRPLLPLPPYPYPSPSHISFPCLV